MTRAYVWTLIAAGSGGLAIGLGGSALGIPAPLIALTCILWSGLLCALGGVSR